MCYKTIIAGALAAAAYTLPAHAQVSDDVLKIGVLTDMAGVAADITGKGSVVAAEMAVEEFSSTVLGKPIQIISADHQHKADIGASIARKWLDVENVDAIADIPNSAVALAIQNLAREKKRIALFSGAGSTALTNDQCSPYGFHWTYDTYSVSHGTASAVVKAGGASWFMLASDYAFGHQLAKDAGDVVKASGGDVLGEVLHPLGTADFSSFLLQAQSSGAKVIGIANAGADTVNAIKQAGEFGIVEQGQSLAALILFLQDVHSLGLAVAKGTYLTTASYWDIDDQSRVWSEKFKSRTGMMPSMVHAGVYGSVLHYLKAVEKAGTDDAGKVAAAIRELPINDAFTHDAHVREDGRVLRDMYLARVKEPSASKGEWDYFEIVSKIPAADTVWPLDKSTCPLVKK
ncbi:amino acid/amide ABC transporter substrate-binding protein, HAAT family [Mesorhizobium albiziae]|uniref:Amino acid/amide ABC transporter substrate-binding protein, HAAT family n=1 Tax=Neomesorhizobium albiziae TaxID=335020 RepID=A0A1I4E5I5_9HYPH|nr:ABC transporter substrate-binding protein [Mesorhizobium albiziae]GLS31251.1 ABC transporter permease [Mesorhizobium albiziae]SFK99421.1 amino acid/amide ABC transporter substrate-binding protein, HAAT family [Mesorhizobium albiziae]